MGLLPIEVIQRMLRYLCMDYWRHYLGWPDLLLYRESDYFFAEVKGSGDKLSDDQKEWITGNRKVMHIPFKLVKIHKAGTIVPSIADS